MSLEVTSNAVGSHQLGAAASAFVQDTIAEKNQTQNTSGNIVIDQPKNTGGSVRTETSDAVKPTPVNAPATIVDFQKSRAMEGDVPQYPISGPDQFAKSMAQRSVAEFEESNDPAMAEEAEIAGETSLRSQAALETRNTVANLVESVDEASQPEVTAEQATSRNASDSVSPQMPHVTASEHSEVRLAEN